MPLLIFVMAIVVLGGRTDCLFAEETGAVVPTFANVAYGPHERNTLDFWQAPGDGPKPLLILIHHGGWTGGEKTPLPPRAWKFISDNGQAASEELTGDAATLKPFLDKGISCAAINYRFTTEAPLPAPVHDAARAVQFLKSKSEEWNIRKDRVAVAGCSAGATSALWIALHEDIADLKSADPVARESTRVVAVAGSTGQTTIDPKIIGDWVGPAVFEHRMLYLSVGEATLEEALKNYAQHKELYHNFSPINHVTAGDPPIWLSYGPNMKLPSSSARHGIHHGVLGVKLKEKADSAGVECHLIIPDYSKSKDYRYGHDFLLKKLLVP